jgi:hypothetical protein
MLDIYCTYSLIEARLTKSIFGLSWWTFNEWNPLAFQGIFLFSRKPKSNAHKILKSSGACVASAVPSQRHGRR